MDDGRRATVPPLRRWVQALDDVRPWGSLDVWPNRYGFRKYRLVVFPPWIGPTERRYLRLARSWPTWGCALWLILAVALSAFGGGWNTLVYPTGVLLLTGAITFVLARDAYSHTRTLTAALLAGHDDPKAAARFERLEALARTLLAADTMQGRGEITVVEHEAVWWMVYEALGRETRADA